MRTVVRTSLEAGVRHLTLYAFSTENWSRPPEEVRGLLRHCTFAEIRDCGHILHLENEDGFNREFDAWLARVRER